MVTEVNPGLGAESVTLAYQDDFVRPADIPFAGTSLTAMVNLGRQLGYRFVGTERFGINAFFVRDDLVPEGLSEPTIQSVLARPVGQALRGPDRGVPGTAPEFAALGPSIPPEHALTDEHVDHRSPDQLSWPPSDVQAPAPGAPRYIHSPPSVPRPNTETPRPVGSATIAGAEVSVPPIDCTGNGRREILVAEDARMVELPSPSRVA